MQMDAAEPYSPAELYSPPSSMPGSCALTPHAAAALHFWLSQGSISPHMQATHLHNMHTGMTDPASHHFPGNTHLQVMQQADLRLIILCKAAVAVGQYSAIQGGAPAQGCWLLGLATVYMGRML